MANPEVQSGSEPDPNSSEGNPDAGAKLRGGRPAVVSDEALQASAIEFHNKWNRWPRLQDLMDQAGCQKQRASIAIKAAMESVSRAELTSALSIPSKVDHAMRQCYSEFVQAAAEKYGAIHAETVAAFEMERAGLLLIIEELRDNNDDLEAQLVTTRGSADELRRQLSAADAAIQEMRDQKLQIESIAKERKRMLAQLSPEMIGKRPL